MNTGVKYFKGGRGPIVCKLNNENQKKIYAYKKLCTILFKLVHFWKNRTSIQDVSERRIFFIKIIIVIIAGALLPAK